MWALMVETCLCLPVSEGIISWGRGGPLWWPLEMTSDPLKRLRGRLGGDLQMEPALPRLITSDAHPPGIWDCVSHYHEIQTMPGGLQLLLTLFEGPAVRVRSSYAATSSHVATTACVGVNFASGNPRCTSWVSRWMNEWWGQEGGG